jgi:hypothetical protein
VGRRRVPRQWRLGWQVEEETARGKVAGGEGLDEGLNGEGLEEAAGAQEPSHRIRHHERRAQPRGGAGRGAGRGMGAKGGEGCGEEGTVRASAEEVATGGTKQPLLPPPPPISIPIPKVPAATAAAQPPSNEVKRSKPTTPQCHP